MTIVNTCSETMFLLCFAVAAELYAASLWLCYRRGDVHTSDKLLYAAFALLILSIKIRLEV